jgi:hypothetical protein
MQVKYDNVAGRLLVIFQRLRSVNKKDLEMWKAWCEALQLDKRYASRDAALEHLALILEAITGIERTMEEVKGDKAPVYVNGLRPLKEAVLSTDLNAKYGESVAVGLLTSDAMRFLEICANELPKEG